MMTINDIGFAFMASAIALLVASFLVGRLFELRSKSTQEETIGALSAHIKQKEAQLEDLRKEKEQIMKDGYQAKADIDRWDSIRNDHKNLVKMQQELDEFERQESNRIDELERRRAEAATRFREIQALLDQYPHEMIQEQERWEDYISKRKEVYDELKMKITAAEEKLVELKKKITAAKEELAELKQAQNLREDEWNEHKGKLKETQAELENYLQILEDIKKQIAEAQTILEAKKEALKVVNDATIQFPDDDLSISIKEIPERRGPKKSTDKLGAFRNSPECLREFDSGRRRDEKEEEELLHDFENALKEVRLEYSKRIIRAFHTALKVNDLSPLTVLSGLSGTGKSQLPRAYSRFFGINFLHVPVEPGWDSPQDILGFYDFVAERYRPTDRARALGHFDMRFAKDLKIETDQDWSKRMLVILLDEMNLARTEYYFSEFLSRLEMRGPRNGTEQDKDSLQNAQIFIDLPYAEGESPKHLYVPHNVLWVGTLNEDETTQALSDKVLDRANSIRFAPPNPSTLKEHSTAPVRNIKKAAGFLPYERWLNWSDTNQRRNIYTEQIDLTLEQLAIIMQDASCGFGFRITQSIKAYVDRYPGRDWKIPMIDQINMRLLPKLAGSEMDDCRNAVNKLIDLCEGDLNDHEFANALKKAVEASETSQIFMWPGYTYE